ncbi:MAG: discoidin domain-containing protein [Sporichthyaceae bacterium]
MRAGRTAFLASAVALVLSACGGSDEAPAAAAPLPAEQLLDGPAKVTPEAGGTTAVLVASTRANAACRVFYGRSPSADEGSATDQDMDKTGPHTTHKAVMTGLVPGTKYWYRFEGTDESGQKYAGAGGTFTTAEALKPEGKNLALTGTVKEFSSEFGPGYEAKRAIDGDPATEWSTAGDGDKAFIVVDLGAVHDLTGIGFRTRSMSDGTSITKEIAVVVDGQRFGPFTVGEGENLIPLKAKGRLVRIELVKTTGGNTGAQDIKVYGR